MYFHERVLQTLRVTWRKICRFRRLRARDGRERDKEREREREREREKNEMTASDLGEIRSTYKYLMRHGLPSQLIELCICCITRHQRETTDFLVKEAVSAPMCRRNNRRENER